MLESIDVFMRSIPKWALYLMALACLASMVLAIFSDTKKWKREKPATMDDFYRIQSELERWHEEENRLFDEYWAESTPEQRDADDWLDKFKAYEKANWSLKDVPYERG